MYIQVCDTSSGEIQGLHDFVLSTKLVGRLMIRKGVEMKMEVAKFADDSVAYI